MKGHKLLYGASVLMVLGFCVHLLLDYRKYRASFGSAPFWIWVCVDAVVWLVPAVLASIAGYIAKKKLSKKENHQ